MDAPRFSRLKQEFQDLLEAGPEQRAVALERVTREDAVLGAELGAWLAAEEQRAGDWLERPAVLGGGDKGESSGGEAPAPERVGPWRLEAEIGRGGMGSVFRGSRDDGAFEQTVAIKLVRAELASEVLRRRFLAERRILAGLVHPSIAHLIDGGTTEDGVPYLVLEHVAGEPIDRYCDRHALSVDERLRLFIVVCGAVSFAHQKLVLHRDIKPANVLVDETGRPKLLDFGIAKLLAPSAEEEDWTALGVARPLTPEWASPEQLRGEPLTTASDVYSLGVLLHVLLTGRRPHRFSGQAPEAFARKIEESGGTPPLGAGRLAVPPGVASRSLRGDLQQIVARALAPEIDRRYGTVVELAEDIDCHLSGLPVSAHPPSVRYRIGKLVRRHRAATVAVPVAALALVAFLLAIAWEARRARHGEERARAHFDDVRRLANASLFDLHDAIRELPGSLPARRALARHALEYLRVLAAEASEDPALRLELATAYRKVGDVQGGIFLASSGETAAALTNYENAADLLEQLIAQGDHSPVRVSALADELLAVSDGFQSTGDFHRAATIAQRAIALRQRLPVPLLQTPREQLLLGVAQVHLGRALREGGEDGPALLATREGVRLLAPLPAAPGELPGARRQLAKAYNQHGSLLADPQRAIAAHEKALAIQVALCAAEPQNAQLARELAWTLGDMTRPLGLIGDTERFESNLRRAAAIFERQLTEHPGNAVDALDLASVLIGLGWVRTAAGDFQGAHATLTRAQRLAENALATDPGSNWAHETMWQIYSQLGDTTEAAASAAPSPAARQQGLRRARDWFAKSRAVLAALAARGQLEARYAADLEKLDQKIARCGREKLP
jgi:hypothetical protein